MWGLKNLRKGKSLKSRIVLSMIIHICYGCARFGLVRFWGKTETKPKISVFGKPKPKPFGFSVFRSVFGSVFGFWLVLVFDFWFQKTKTKRNLKSLWDLPYETLISISSNRLYAEKQTWKVRRWNEKKSSEKSKQKSSEKREIEWEIYLAWIEWEI